MNDFEHIQQLISAYRDGETTPEETARAKKIIETDPAARQYWQQLNAMKVALDAWTDEDLSPDCEAKIARRLRPDQQRKEHVMKPLVRQLSVIVVLVVTAVLSVNVYLQRGMQGRLRTAAYEDAYIHAPQQDTQGVERARYDQLARYDQSAEPYYLSTSYGQEEQRASVLSSSRTESAEVKLKEGMASTMHPQPGRDAGGREVFRAGEGKGIYDEDVLRKVRAAGPVPDMAVQNETFYPAIEGDRGPYDSVDHGTDRRGPYPYYGTEEYGRVVERHFADARRHPLSTFSVDVDTASYSNVRRFLNQNRLPPRDAVRIEEMINYFVYDYPQPGWGKPFSVTTEAGPAPWNPRHRLVLVGLQGKMLKARDIPPSNIVFLIDVSGSMRSSNKLPLLKHALKMMVNKLRPNETISIVTYAGQARLHLDATSGGEKAVIYRAIDSLHANGSTAGERGIHLAYSIARRHFIRNGNNRVILASDGDFNVGVSSEEELVRLIEHKRREGIFLTVLGFGTGNLKDNKMEQLADHGDGNYFYIDSRQEAEKVLVNELGATLLPIAKDVKVQVEFNPDAVYAYRLIGYENRALAHRDFNDDRIDAGEVGSGHAVTALYEIIPSTAEALVHNESGVDALKYQDDGKWGFFGSREMMTVKVRYKKPDGNSSRLITATVTDDEAAEDYQRSGALSRNFRWAAAVAEFGMLLRESPLRGDATYDRVLSRVRRATGRDTWGHRAEFIRLVETARRLHRPVRYESPRPYDEYPAHQSTDHPRRYE